VAGRGRDSSIVLSSTGVDCCLGIERIVRVGLQRLHRRHELEGFRERAGSKFQLPDRDAIASAIDPEVLLHLRHNLRIGEFVSGLDIDSALRKHLGSAETLLQFQLCLTGPEDQKGLGLSQLTDYLIVVLLKTLTVPFLVLLLASAILPAGSRTLMTTPRCMARSSRTGTS
jgi:hypothetical protein